jgi:hypothetical protein
VSDVEWPRWIGGDELHIDQGALANVAPTVIGACGENPTVGRYQLVLGQPEVDEPRTGDFRFGNQSRRKL